MEIKNKLATFHVSLRENQKISGGTMIWFFAAGAGLLALASFLPGCRETDTAEQTKSKEGNQPKNTKPSLSTGQGDEGAPEGTVYPFRIDGEDLRLYHQDKNSDKIFQSESDTLFLRVKDQYLPYGNEAFEKYRQRFQLPTFQGLDVARWHKIHQEFFSQEATPEQTKRLFALQQFCKARDIDFKEPMEISSRIKTGTAADKLAVLSIVSFLLSLQKEKEGGFYHAKNLQGKKENKEFIDKVFSQIKDGKLKIEDAGGRKLQGFEQYKEYMAYNHDLNTLYISRQLDLSQLSTGESIIHELTHFNQDLKKEPLPLLTLEVAAYIKGGEYVIHTAGLTKTKQEETLENLIVRDLGLEADAPDAHSIRTAYYRVNKESKKSNEWFKKLEDSVIYYYYLIRVFKNVLDPANEKAKQAVAKSLNESLNQTGKPKVDKQMIEYIRASFEKESEKVSRLRQELETYLETGKKGKLEDRLVEKKTKDYFHHWVYFRFIKQYIMQIDSALTSSKGEVAAEVNLSETDPDVQQMLRSLVPLRLSAYVYRMFNGVE